MDILVPKNIFLRVTDKFVPDFIDNDKAVASSPTLLYKKLFVACSDTGKSKFSQHYLASQCKFSVRTLQYALRRLSDLGYIHVEHEAGGCNTYMLLLSEYVMRQLETCDLIDRSDWCPSPERACTEEVSPEQPRSDEPAAPVAIPLQDVQEGYAKVAPLSYNVDKNSKNQTPPSPSSTPQPFRGGSSASSEGADGGDSISFTPKKKTTKAAHRPNLHSEFKQLWDAWPVKNDLPRARRTFFSLAKTGELPTIATLLASMEKFKAEDSRWKNGYVKWLSNWLRGHCWAEQPLVRPARKTPQTGSIGAAQTEEKPLAPNIARQLQHIAVCLQAPAPAPSEPAPWITQAVDELCTLWPRGAARVPIQAFLKHRLTAGSSVKQLLNKAQKYVQESMPPMPLVNWLRIQPEELYS